MSASDTDSSVGLSRGFRPNGQMNLFGWLIFLPMLFIILPLLPVLVLYWAVSRLVSPTAPGGEEA